MSTTMEAAGSMFSLDSDLIMGIIFAFAVAGIIIYIVSVFQVV